MDQLFGWKELELWQNGPSVGFTILSNGHRRLACPTHCAQWICRYNWWFVFFLLLISVTLNTSCVLYIQTVHKKKAKLPISDQCFGLKNISKVKYYVIENTLYMWADQIHHIHIIRQSNEKLVPVEINFFLFLFFSIPTMWFS